MLSELSAFVDRFFGQGSAEGGRRAWACSTAHIAILSAPSIRPGEAVSHSSRRALCSSPTSVSSSRFCSWVRVLSCIRVHARSIHAPESHSRVPGARCPVCLEGPVDGDETCIPFRAALTERSLRVPCSSSLLPALTRYGGRGLTGQPLFVSRILRKYLQPLHSAARAGHHTRPPR